MKLRYILSVLVVATMYVWSPAQSQQIEDGDKCDAVKSLGELTLDQMVIIEQCFDDFTNRVEKLKASNDPLLQYDGAEEEIAVRTRVLQLLGRRYEVGGAFDNAIHTLGDQIAALKDSQSAGLDGKIMELSARYDVQAELAVTIRKKIGTELLRLTNYRPILANQIRFEEVSSLVSGLESINGAASGILGQVTQEMNESEGVVTRTGN